MICSKIDTIKEKRRKACNNLESALKTERGTSEARTEAVMRRQQAKQSGMCNGCGRNDVHLNQDGYCSSCTAAMNRMLQFKSKLAVEWPKERRLRTFIEDYKKVTNPPYSLRGSADRSDIIEMAEYLLDVVIELDYETKKLNTTRRDNE